MTIQYINEADIVRTTWRNKINSNFIDLDNSKAEKNLSNVDDSIILEKLKNVDWDGSWLDADLLDWFDSNDFEKVVNKVSSWQTTPDDIHYPSEKLVKDSLDLKADDNEVVHLTWTETITGRKTFNNDVDINWDVNIDWNVNIKWNLNYVDTENLQVEDKVIILDKGWSNADWSWLEVEENWSIVASLKYNKWDNRWNDWVDNLARVGEITDLDNNKANKDLSNVSNTDFLNKIKAVDWSWSWIDADLLDWKQASDFALSSHTHNWWDISKSWSKLSDIEDVQAYTWQAWKLLAVKNTEDWTEWVPVEAVSWTDELVKADSWDSTAGYLSDKVDWSTLEVDTSTHKIKVKDWVFATDSNVVHKTWDETISWVKTFSGTINLTGEFDWQASKNFKLKGSWEWSFDFSDDDGNDYLQVRAPNIWTIFAVRNNWRLWFKVSNPKISFAFWDNDTGLNYVSDWEFDFYSNNSAKLQIKPSYIWIQVKTVLYDNPIYLRSSWDDNHIIWFASWIDWPEIRWCQGVWIAKNCWGYTRIAQFKGNDMELLQNWWWIILRDWNWNRYKLSVNSNWELELNSI